MTVAFWSHPAPPGGARRMADEPRPRGGEENPQVSELTEAYGNRTRRPEMLGSHGFEDDETRPGTSDPVTSGGVVAGHGPGGVGPVRDEIAQSGRIVVASWAEADARFARDDARRAVRRRIRRAALAAARQHAERHPQRPAADIAREFLTRAMERTAAGLVLIAAVILWDAMVGRFPFGLHIV